MKILEIQWTHLWTSKKNQYPLTYIILLLAKSCAGFKLIRPMSEVSSNLLNPMYSAHYGFHEIFFVRNILIWIGYLLKLWTYFVLHTFVLSMYFITALSLWKLYINSWLLFQQQQQNNFRSNYLYWALTVNLFQ